MVEKYKGISVFAGVGERSREGHELLTDMQGSGVLARTVLVYGQMNEPPGARWRVAPAALTIAEYFRDRSIRMSCSDGQRLSLRSGGERVIGLTGKAAFASGLSADIGHRGGLAAGTDRFGCRCGHHRNQAVYVPADDFTDPAVTAISSHIDSTIMLSRTLAAQGIYPAIDPLVSSSVLLDPLVLGKSISSRRRTREALARFGTCRTSSHSSEWKNSARMTD